MRQQAHWFPPGRAVAELSYSPAITFPLRQKGRILRLPQ